MQIVVDDLLVSYKRSSQGRKAVLLLHGWGDDSSTFQKLNASLEKYDVIAVDLAGFGASQPPSFGWGLEDYAKHIKAFCLKLGIDPYAIIGHSNGGAIAVYGCSMGIFVPKKLVLLGASGIRKRSKSKQALRIMAKPGKLALKAFPKQAQTKSQKWVYKKLGSDYQVVPGMKETFKKVVSQDLTDDAYRVSAPTLLIYGSDDKATPVTDGETYARVITNSRLVVINGGEHFVHLDHADEVNRNVKEFLDDASNS